MTDTLTPQPSAGRFAGVAAVLRQAIEARAFPAASMEVGRHDRIEWRGAFGGLSYDADAAPASADTIFDLASLTKVIATTTLVMQLAEAGRLRLTDPVAQWLPEWSGPDRAQATIENLLVHTSGLTAYLPFYRDCRGRAEFQRAICTLPLEYPPRSQSVYSDLGFVLLGFIVEDAGGARLDRQFDRLAARLALTALRHLPPRAWRARTAPTEVDTWRGRLLVGEVHDENAWALDGVAGHAGLFGSTSAVGAFARQVLQTLKGRALLASPGTMQAFVRPSVVADSSRALGWDTMRPSSSCGHCLSPAAIGHTGFTGTSLWIDPVRDVYVVLLTNRVHPSRQNDAILEIRPRVHDEAMAALQNPASGDLAT